MEKIVLKAFYRTDDEIYSTGYIILDDNTEVLYFDSIEATIYSFTEEPKKII